MDSPKSSAPTTALTESEPEVIEESPVFSFISKLSPIPSVKIAAVMQGFPGLNSPPLVFRSPQLNDQRQTAFVKREQSPGKSSAQDGDCKIDEYAKSWLHHSTSLFVSTAKETENKCPGFDQIECPTENPDQFLTDVSIMKPVDPNISSDSPGNSPRIADQDVIASASETADHHEREACTIISQGIALGTAMQVEEVHKEDTPIGERQVETDSKCEDDLLIDMSAQIESKLPVDHDFSNTGQNCMINSVNVGQDGPLDPSSCLQLGSVEINSESTGLVDGVHQAESVPKNNLQLRGVSRRCLQFEDAQVKVMSNQLSQNPSDAESIKSPPLQSLTSQNERTCEGLQPKFAATNVNSSIRIPKPSGIGLHLNSIVNTVVAGPGLTVNVKSSQRIIISMQDNSIVPNTTVDLSTPSNERKYDVETDVGVLSSKSSLQKKRKKSSDSSDGDGFKRCKCKKSKCLKLYCDCFADGLYCGESCSCQDCYNKPEHDVTVLETRKLIESRNPLAFAPKVVHRIAEPSAAVCEDDRNLSTTPASARHKRGCNCKKSMCLKKYCECYQAKVGCSEGCRCDGCKNVFGKKGEYATFHRKFVTHGHGSYETQLYSSSHSSTPVTPAIQSLNHGKDDDASQEWFDSEKYSQSFESGPEDILDQASSDQRSSYNNAQTVNQLSKAINLSDLQNPHNWSNCSKPQYIVGNYYSSSANSSLWLGSPNTPMAQQSRPNNILQVVDPDSELSSIIQDDTPEILKESPRTLNAVKVSSPNKKRVSPPHNQAHETSSSSLIGLKTGRKYILKAVPSFPPLTPCADSKSATFQPTEDPENPIGNQN